MTSYYITDFVRECSETGEEAFAARYDRPCLVGLGMAGEIAHKDAGRGEPLTAAVNLQELLERGLWLDRVYVLKPSSMSSHPEEMVVGRGSDADVLIAERSISRRHCVFRVVPGSYLVGDLGGANGTVVNQVKVGASPVALGGGEVIVLGRLAFRFVTPQGFHELVRLGVVRQTW